MDGETRAAAGWYPNQDRPGEVRYWDGEQWTEHRAQRLKTGPDTWVIARGVAIGILAAVAALWVLGAYVL